MTRHPLVALLAILSLGFAHAAVARSAGSASGGAGHGGAVSAGFAHGMGRGGIRAAGPYRSSTIAFSAARERFVGGFGYGRGFRRADAYGAASFGNTPSYVSAGIFTPGNPTQTPISAPAIYQVEPAGRPARAAGQGSGHRRPGIYQTGVSDGIQPNIYVIRVPRG